MRKFDVETRLHRVGGIGEDGDADRLGRNPSHARGAARTGTTDLAHAGHTPLVEPDERSAAEATELPAIATAETRITVLAAAAHHQDILRNINTLPIALGARKRAPKRRA